MVLPRLDDSEFLTQLNKADTHRKDTIEALDQFDYEQSIGIRNLQTDLAKMQQYVSQVKTAFTSGKLQIDTFESGDLKNQGIDELIKTDVEANSCSREELELAEQKRIEDLKNKLINAASTEEYLKIANEIGFENLTEAQQGIVLELETGKQSLEMLKGIGVGLFDAGKDLVTGIWDFATGEPITEIRPVETFNYIKKAILDSFERDVTNGDSYSRAHWISYAVATVFSGGIGATGKAGVVTTKAVKGAETVNEINKTVDIKKYLPYSPQHQLATPEGIPYNVVNSEGLKEKLISMARVETKSTSKDIKNYRKTFFDEYPELEGSVVVHHAIEQQVLKKFPNLFTLEEIHVLENLRGIPKEINSDIHLSKIRKDWNRFYRNHPNPTKEEIISYMIELDKKYGENFNPPVKK